MPQEPRKQHAPNRMEQFGDRLQVARIPGKVNFQPRHQFLTALVSSVDHRENTMPAPPPPGCSDPDPAEARSSPSTIFAQTSTLKS